MCKKQTQENSWVYTPTDILLTLVCAYPTCTKFTGRDNPSNLVVESPP